MSNEMIWTLIYIWFSITISAWASLWFLLPKKWIVWSEKAADILPHETVPPWSSLNKLGKALYILFAGGVTAMFVTLIVSALIQ